MRARQMYTTFLKLVCAVRAVKRTLLRRAPLWARDAYDLLGYVNFFKLLPIIVAIALVPRHFFQNLRVNKVGKSRLFLDPFKTTTTFASLIVILASKFGLLLEHQYVLGGLVVTAISSPIWTVIMIGLSYYLLSPAPWVRVFLRRLWSDQWYGLFFSITALRRLEFSLYVQGLFYYVVYFIVIVPLLCLVSIAGALTATGLLAFLSPDIRDVGGNILQWILVLFVFLFPYLIVKPLAELFYACLSRPTAAAYGMSLQTIEYLIRRARKRINRATGEVPTRVLSRMRAELRRLISEFRMQERVFLRSNQEQYPEFLSERAKACEELSDCFEFLGAGDIGLKMEIECLLSARPFLGSIVEVMTGIGC